MYSKKYISTKSLRMTEHNFLIFFKCVSVALVMYLPESVARGSNEVTDVTGRFSFTAICNIPKVSHRLWYSIALSQEGKRRELIKRETD